LKALSFFKGFHELFRICSHFFLDFGKPIKYLRFG